MLHKRPFVDEDSYEVASKQPRQLEHARQLAHTTAMVPVSDPEKPRNSGNLESIVFI
jgi:hypothetical protein